MQQWSYIKAEDLKFDSKKIRRKSKLFCFRRKPASSSSSSASKKLKFSGSNDDDDSSMTPSASEADPHCPSAIEPAQDVMEEALYHCSIRTEIVRAAVGVVIDSDGVLELVREPSNVHDRHALAVMCNQHKIGYIRASLAVYLSPLLDGSRASITSISSSSSSAEILLGLSFISMRDRDEITWSASISIESLFSSALKFVRSHYLHILSELELQSISEWSVLSPCTQNTLLRLLSRVAPLTWITSSRYSNLQNLTTNLIISSSSYLTSTSTIPLSQLCSLVESSTLAELRPICDRLSLGCRSTMKLDEIRARLLGHLRHQRCISGCLAGDTASVQRIILDHLHDRIRVQETALISFRRLHSLYTLSSSSSSGGGGGIRLDRGQHRYVDVQTTKCGGPFRTREELLQMEDALQIADRAEQAEHDQDWEVCNECLIDAKAMLVKLEEVEADVDCWTRFRGWYILGRAIHRCLSALHRQHRYADLVRESMYFLTHPECHLLRGHARRGRWWSTLLLVLDVHLKQSQRSFHVGIKQALVDEHLKHGERIAVLDRCCRLWKKFRIGERCALRSQLSSVSDYSTIVVIGRPVNCTVGERSRFFGFDDQVCSVEDLSLQYFASDVGGRWCGVHDEGSLLRHIVGCLLWNALWNDTIEHVFVSPVQTCPLDFGLSSFYDRRSDEIESLLASLTCASTACALICSVYEKGYGRVCSAVNWDRFDLDVTVEVCSAIISSNAKALPAWIRMVCKAEVGFRGGMPDLCLYRHEKAGGSFAFKFVEVKGPRDTLFEQQRHCLDALIKAGFDVQICKVKEPKAGEAHVDPDDDEQNHPSPPSSAASNQAADRRRDYRDDYEDEFVDDATDD